MLNSTLKAKPPRGSLFSWPSINKFLQGVIVLTSAFFMASYTRLATEFQFPLSTNYEGYPMNGFLICIGVALVGWLILANGLDLRLPYHLLGYFIFIGVGSVGLLWWVLPDLDKVHLIMFGSYTLANILLLVVWSKIYLKISNLSIVRDLQHLWKNRVLIGLWVRFGFEGEYADSALGTIWLVLQPLLMAGVYALAFSSFLGIKPTTREDLPFVSFILVGITVFKLFSMGLSGGARSVVGKKGLLTQINISPDIFVMVFVGTLLVDFLIGLLSMMLMNAVFFGIYPNVYYVYLPLLIGIFAVFVMGIIFWMGSLGVFIRDLPEFLTLVVRMAFFLSPIFYSAESIPAHFQFAMTLSPVAVMINNFRAVVLFETTPDMLEVLYLGILAVMMFYLGYTYFKAKERQFIDLL